ncbi:MAG: preprotein translocase subunit YajC [Gammaproteobacteria bacterium]|nr:preprotein translocase subunit YajC [Gammaproteobacteria bacterium]
MGLLISNAYADVAVPAAGGGDPITMIVFFGGMIAIFYFLLIRPQQKRSKEHRKMVEALGKNDEVISNGMLGKIVEVGEQYLTLEIAPNVHVKVQRSAVSIVLPKGSIKAAEKA